jgi:hypothetical protein
MLREPRKTEQTIKPCKEANQKERRFRIVKLEERIAPGKHGGGGNGKTGVNDGCNGKP